MLKIKGLRSYYGESEILHGIDLAVPDGKIVALVGRNGVGKTTTLKSVMGLVKAPEGDVFLDGVSLRRMPPYERARQGIGYVPQGRDIFPQMTVAENLRLGLEVCGGRKQDAEELYELFPIVKKFLARKGGDLSGGQQQQLAIARALIARPKLLLLDEPTEGIQPSVIQEIGDAIRTINQKTGISILLVEQYLDFALELADDCYVMDKGRVRPGLPARRRFSSICWHPDFQGRDAVASRFLVKEEEECSDASGTKGYGEAHAALCGQAGGGAEGKGPFAQLSGGGGLYQQAAHGDGTGRPPGHGADEAGEEDPHPRRGDGGGAGDGRIRPD